MIATILAESGRAPDVRARLIASLATGLGLIQPMLARLPQAPGWRSVYHQRLLRAAAVCRPVTALSQSLGPLCSPPARRSLHRYVCAGFPSVTRAHRGQEGTRSGAEFR